MPESHPLVSYSAFLRGCLQIAPLALSISFIQDRLHELPEEALTLSLRHNCNEVKVVELPMLLQMTKRGD